MANKNVKKKESANTEAVNKKGSANTEAVKEKTSPLGLDEGTMIREQERIALAGKKKKRKKWKLLGLGVAAVLILTGIWYINWGRDQQMQAMADSTVKIEKGVGQTVVYAHIDTINGNEITYTLLEEVQTEESNANNTNDKAEVSESNFPSGVASEGNGRRPQQGGSMPEGFGGGSMPEGFGGGSMPESFGGGRGQGGTDNDTGSGTMPDMSQMPGGFGGGSMPEGFGGGSMPEGFSGGSMPEGFGGGSMPEGFGGGSMPEGFGGGSMPGGFGGGSGNMGMMSSGNSSGNAESSMLVYDGKTYRMGSERVTKYIPVGTDVTTKLGTITTFSRLAAEDYVALVMEQDGKEAVIMAVYIIG